MIPSRPIIFISAIRRRFGGTRGILVTGYEPEWQLITPAGPVTATRAKGKPVR